MKFCKKYQAYMQGLKEKIPVLSLKQLKKTLKKCRNDLQSDNGINGVHYNQTCPDHCPDSEANRYFGAALPELVTIAMDETGKLQALKHIFCDGTFFPSLLKEMSAVVGCFNERAQKLLELNLASGFRRYLIWFKGKLQNNHGTLIREVKDLVTYALINAIAIRKILKKYDKIHYSKQGQTFKSQAQSMHIEILQSPWLCELMAFHINLRKNKVETSKALALFEGCDLTFNNGKPSLNCELFDSVKVDIDLTCSICLDTVFDAVSLTCGHIFCYMCACSAAAVTIVDGLKSAEPNAKCPLCREAGVYEGAVYLDELNILLSRSCSEYWEERLQSERAERIRQTKEHWENHCREFMGV